MTSAERSYLEEKLFHQANLDANLHNVIKDIYKRYKDALEMFPYLHEARFGMLYCKMILENKNNEMPHFSSIIFFTKETQTSYYTYRKQVLDCIWKILKSEKLVAE